jgi:hypothetical protein
LAADRCPHCALPGLFSNVRAADDVRETHSLQTRYAAAMDRATRRGVEGTVRAFGEAMKKTRAVINRPLGEIHRLAQSDENVYATYYQLRDSGVRIPSGDVWDKRRTVTDEMLFPGYKEKIRFGALTVDGHGVWHYGDFALVLKESTIAHRASVLEENSVMFMQRHNIRVFNVDALPKGYRAVWAERDKVCVAKLADRLHDKTKETDHARLVLKQGAKPDEDEFVEVHIWGPLTIRSFEHIYARKGKLRPVARVLLRDLKEQLEPMGVQVEMCP